MSAAPRRWVDGLLAWYFVSVWGTGYVATKVGLQYAAPFTFLSLRFAFGLLLLSIVVSVWKPEWPKTLAGIAHLAVAGLLMHAVQLGGSHYAQYLGMSAGVAALIIACQPILTSMVSWKFFGEKVLPVQWLGIALGLAGVTLVVWHKFDIREVTWGSLLGTLIALTGVTSATLYQKRFSPQADLKAAAVIQFAASLAVLVPLGFVFEGIKVIYSWQLAGAIAYLVVFASILAVSVLHLLMRHGEATRVTSMMYLPPVFAVGAELALFGVLPGPLALAGMAITCAGVALAAFGARREPSAAID